MQAEFLLDYHTHSMYSFDGHEPIIAMARAAEAAGVCEIAITDHCDIDGILDGFYPAYDGDAIEKAIDFTREIFDGKLKILHGIELGQAYVRPDEARALIDRYKYDFVIASLHNMRDKPDFSFLKYDNMGQKMSEIYFKRSLDEMLELVGFSGIHTLAHLTYPVRYMRKCGIDIDYRQFYPQLEKLYKTLIEKGIALEINTSGLRTAAKCFLPDRELIELYKECGGELITVGSDAHIASDIGTGILEAYDIMREIGFKYVCGIADGRLVPHEI